MATFLVYLFKVRLTFINLLSIVLFYILFDYSNITYLQLISYIITTLLMNYTCLQNTSYISTQIWWIFTYLGFVLSPVIALLGRIDFFEGGSIWFGILTMLSLTTVSYIAQNYFPYKHISNQNKSEIINKNIKFLTAIFSVIILVICWYNFNNTVYFRGVEASDTYHPIFINFINFTITFLFPMVLCWLFFHLTQYNSLIAILFLFFSNSIIYASIGSRGFLIFVICILYEFLRRNAKINNKVVFSIIVLFIVSFYSVSEKRKFLYSFDETNKQSELFPSINKITPNKLYYLVNSDIIKVDFKKPIFTIYIYNKAIFKASLLSFETLLRRWSGQDGIFYTLKYLKSLDEEEVFTIRKKILNEKKIKYKINWYETLMPGHLITKKELEGKLEKNKINTINLPGIAGFLVMFFGHFGFFLSFSIILIIIKCVEYLNHKVFPGHWMFASFISLTLIIRFVNFGVYFAETYKIFIALSIVFFIYKILHSSNIIKMKIK